MTNVFGLRPVLLVVLLFYYFPKNWAYLNSRNNVLSRPSDKLQQKQVGCRIDLPGFDIMLYKEQDNWQSCVDSINSNPTEHLSSFNKSIEGFKIPYCKNQEIYKNCWISIVYASDTCMKEVKGIAGAVYLQLGGDLCDDEIWIILVTEMKHDFEESHTSCLGNYSISDGQRNQLRQMDDGNICLRFHSNTFDPNRRTYLDTWLNGQDFEKVRQKLKCQPAGQSRSDNGANFPGLFFMYMILLLLPTSIF